MIEKLQTEEYMEAFPIPEGAIFLEFDVPLSQRELAVAALREVFKERNLDLPFGPQLDLDNPERILSLNRFAVQIVTAGMTADEISVPLKDWSKHGQAPQLLLAAQVDQENNVVYFTGVLTGPEFEKLVSNRLREQNQITISVEDFQGGIDRLLRFVRLLQPNAIPRTALLGESEPESFSIKPIQAAVVALLAAFYFGPKMATQIATSFATNEAATLFANNWVDNKDVLLALNSIEVSGSTRSQNVANQLKVCSNLSRKELVSFDKPVIFSPAPLNEVVIKKNGKLIWRKRAEIDSKITGPIPWPVAAIQLGEKYEIAFRSENALVGEWVTIYLEANPNKPLQSFDSLVNSLGRDKGKWITTIDQQGKVDRQLFYALLLSDKLPRIKVLDNARAELLSKNGCL